LIKPPFALTGLPYNPSFAVTAQKAERSGDSRLLPQELMRKSNTNEIVEESWSSPKGKFVGAGKEVSEALGRKPQSMDLNERHPFDVEICRVPPGKTPYPYHSHAINHLAAEAGVSQPPRRNRSRL